MYCSPVNVVILVVGNSDGFASIKSISYCSFVVVVVVGVLEEDCGGGLMMLEMNGLLLLLLGCLLLISSYDAAVRRVCTDV